MKIKALAKQSEMLASLEQRIDAIAEYLNIDFVETKGFEVRERKKEIGFAERKS